MKKWILLLFGFIAGLWLLLYLFIPTNIMISRSANLVTNQKALSRLLSDSSKWQNWWPANAKKNEPGFFVNGHRYSIKSNTVSGIFIDVTGKNTYIPTSITYIPGQHDSVKLEWNAALPTSLNPVKRLRVYFEAKTLEKEMDKLLASASSYYSTTKNLYDLDIRRDRVKDSSLVSTYDSAKGFPSTEKIYAMIGQLRDYIYSQRANATDSPMLNIFTKDSIYYMTRVALPTDRKLSSSGKIQYRWMLAGGNILTAVVPGVQKNVDSALTVVEQYIRDYELLSPAIPFYSLITNRLSEKDSTKWTTKIYYPVMYYNNH